MSLTIDDYQEVCTETAFYREKIHRMFETVVYAEPRGEAQETTIEAWTKIAYCAGKLNGEAGEVAEHVFKALRDDQAMITPDRQQALFAELGDVMWYVAMLCNELGFKLENVMDFNLTKLASRQERGVLGGSGSER